MLEKELETKSTPDTEPYEYKIKLGEGAYAAVYEVLKKDSKKPEQKAEEPEQTENGREITENYKKPIAVKVFFEPVSKDKLKEKTSKLQESLDVFSLFYRTGKVIPGLWDREFSTITILPVGQTLSERDQIYEDTLYLELFDQGHGRISYWPKNSEEQFKSIWLFVRDINTLKKHGLSVPGSTEWISLKKAKHPNLFEKIQPMLGYGVKVEMERLPGVALSSFFSPCDNKQLSELTFAQRTQLMLQLVQQVCDLHRRGVIHYDIKSGNVLIHIDKQNKDESKGTEQDQTKTQDSNPTRIILNQYLIDFDISIRPKQPTEENSEWCKVPVRGSPMYHPSESVLHGLAGIKTDTAMLAAPLLNLLLASNPYNSKNNLAANEAVATHFDDWGAQFPKDFNLHWGLNVGRTTLDFIKKMQNFLYRERPDDETLFKFFSTLNQLALCHEQQSQLSKKSATYQAEFQGLQAMKNALARRLELLLDPTQSLKRTVAKHNLLLVALSGVAIGTGFAIDHFKNGSFDHVGDFFNNTVGGVPVSLIVAIGGVMLGLALTVNAYKKYNYEPLTEDLSMYLAAKQLASPTRGEAG